MLEMIALKRKEQEDEAIRQLMKEEAKRKRFKEVCGRFAMFDNSFYDSSLLMFVYRRCWKRQ